MTKMKKNKRKTNELQRNTHKTTKDWARKVWRW